MKTVAAALIMAGAVWLGAATTQTGPKLQAERGSPGDLAVGGAVAAGGTSFIPYQELSRMPLRNFGSQGDSNYAGTVQLGGVALEQLRQWLAPQADMVVAICADGYRSNYPAAYLAAHHPVLVLTIDGKGQAAWPKSAEGGELGPYVIANPDFHPAFKVLSHTDEAQIPFQVVRLEFRRERDVLGPIVPSGAGGSAVMQGYQIAQQNCYRCHNMGAEGGQMASVAWPLIGAIAKGSPEFFAKYVRTPQAVNPHSRMAGSPGYDDATIAALRAYFTTFAAKDKQ